MKILLFGGTGMLGRAIRSEAKARNYEVLWETSLGCPITDFGTITTWLAAESPAVVINAAGMIPPTAGHDSELDRTNLDLRMIRANAEGPHVLALACRLNKVPLVHVSTDCVFSGQLIDEPLVADRDRPEPDSLYGATKAVGEYCWGSDGRVTVVRTSFIGPRHGLVRWFLDQPQNATVEGYSRVTWSGSTVWEVARRLLDIAAEPTGKLEHLATEETSKYDVLLALAKHLRPDITVRPVRNPLIWRSLEPTLPLEFGVVQMHELMRRAQETHKERA